MQIEIDDVLMDKLVVDTLKQDYIRQQEDINRLLSKGELRDFEREDLWMHKETAEALETLLKYYIYRPDAENFIRENSARKRS